jgi:hypothetical protein
MPTRQSINPSAAVLWASAFVIAALVIVQAGRLPGNPAHADSAVTRGDYTLLTTDASAPLGDKLLYIIDSRGQTLLVYEIQDARRNIVVLRESQNLEVMFRRLRD